MEVEACRRFAAMSDQVGLHRPRSGIVPVAEGAERDLAAEGGGGRIEDQGAAQVAAAMRVEEPVDRGGANRPQGVANAGRHPEFAMALERGDELGEERPQALGAQVSAGDPELLQRRLVRFAVLPRPATPRAVGRGAAVEEADEGFPLIAGDPLRLIEEAGFLGFLGQPIARTKRVEVFANRTRGHGASCRW